MKMNSKNIILIVLFLLAISTIGFLPLRKQIIGLPYLPYAFPPRE